jgi:rhodanese-related sulfurtransferase
MRVQEINGPSLDAEAQALANRCLDRHRDVPYVTPLEFAVMVSEERTTTVVDVRPEEERRVSSIPGAFNRETFESCIEMHRTRKILVVCTVGCSSAEYARELRSRDIDAYSLYGGMLAWAAADGDMVDKEGELTRRVALPNGAWSLG